MCSVISLFKRVQKVMQIKGSNAVPAKALILLWPIWSSEGTVERRSVVHCYQSDNNCTPW
jgi:hypothetical protein